MKGGGKSKPSTAAPKAKPAAPPAKAKAAASESKSEEPDDDPFAVNKVAAQKAIAVRAKPSQSHRFKIVCPMCDTVGFVPASAAGQEVRCTNSKCALPVFTAPEIKPKKKPAPEPETEPAKSGISWTAWAVVGLVGVGVAGFSVWEFVLRDTDFSDAPIDTRERDRPRVADTKQDPEPVEPEPDVVEQPVETGPTLADMQREILPMMADLSVRSENNRSKPYCHRLTAEAYAVADETTAAQGELEKLQQVGDQVPYYQVSPLVEIAQSELRGNQTDAANRALDAALQAADQFPTVGRYRLDAGTALAAALIAADRTDEAAQLAARIEDDGAFGRLSGLWQIVRDRGTFDLDAALDNEFWDSWEAPQWTAIALILGAQGKWEQALDWCNRHSEPEQRIGCLVVWAEEYVTDALARQAGDVGLIETAATELTAAQKARLYARAAARQAAAGAREPGEASLQQATSALDELETPQPIELGDMKAVYELELPAAAPLRIAARAATEIAYAQSVLGQNDEAWNSLLKALDFLRGWAPSPAATQDRLDELDRLSTRAASDRLKSVLELETDDAAFRALQTYRNRCAKLHRAAGERFEFQVSLLSHACDWELRDQLWNEIDSRSGDSDSNRQEPYLASSLPWLLAEAYRAASNDEEAERIETLIKDARHGRDPKLELMQISLELIQEQDMLHAARVIGNSRLEKGWREQWFLRTISRLANHDEFEAAYELARRATDPIWGEDAMQLISARAVVSDRAEQFWETVKQRQLNPTDKIALCRGLVAGISAVDEDGN